MELADFRTLVDRMVTDVPPEYLDGVFAIEVSPKTVRHPIYAGVLVMRNNIIQAVHKAGYADGAFDEDYNIYGGGITQFALGPHSAVGNPMFINPGAGDFHLAGGSPAVDSGIDSGYGADVEGRSVPHDGNGDGIAVPDRGAFESS